MTEHDTGLPLRLMRTHSTTLREGGWSDLKLERSPEAERQTHLSRRQWRTSWTEEPGRATVHEGLERADKI